MEFNFKEKGIKATIIEKPEHEMIGFKQSANLGDGSIDKFVKRLIQEGQISRLEQTANPSQQVWLCLADCLSCGLACSDKEVCCIVCIEKTEKQDFSAFTNDELFTFRLPASKWVRYEVHDIQSWDRLFECGIYDLVKEIGFKWNDSIRLHFDNQFECHSEGQWNNGKVGYFLLPVVPQ